MDLENNIGLPGFNYRANGESFDIQPAEVIECNYKDNSPEMIYSIKVVPLYSNSPRTLEMAISARPLDYNTKKMPLVGEVVIILRAPGPGAGGIGQSTQNYYLSSPVSIQSLIHHNVLPDITKVTPNKTFNKNTFGDASIGHFSTNRVNEQAKFAESFVEKTNVRPIQPFAGDTIYEGRFNQSIRFSSTLKNTKDYSVESSWKQGNSTHGDPITIIRNGSFKTPSKVNSFIVEDPQNDVSSIWLTQGQTIPFKPKYNNYKSIDRLSVNSFKVGQNFTGNQLGLFSDRIIIGSKKHELIIQSEGGVAVNSNKSVAFDLKETFEVNSKRINLGFNAQQPVLMGDDTGEWLNLVMTSLIKLTNLMVLEIHLTGTGPSSPPIQAPGYSAIAAELAALQVKIPLLKSKLVYLNKF